MANTLYTSVICIAGNLRKSFALFQDLLATIIIFTTFSEKVLSLSTGVNEQNAQRFFLFIYIYLTLESRPRQRDTKFFEPRLFFHPPTKKNISFVKSYFELNYENTFSTSKRIFFFPRKLSTNFRQTFDQRLSSKFACLV